jgi:hypothetical protein
MAYERKISGALLRRTKRRAKRLGVTVSDSYTRADAKNLRRAVKSVRQANKTGIRQSDGRVTADQAGQKTLAYGQLSPGAKARRRKRRKSISDAINNQGPFG